MQGNLWDVFLVMLWGAFFIAVWAILWASIQWTLRAYHHWDPITDDDSPRGDYTRLSDSPPNTREDLPFIHHGSAYIARSPTPTPSISLIMPSRSSDLQQLYIALQARRETDAAEKQARDAARERASLGSVKSLKVPVRIITPPSRRA